MKKILAFVLLTSFLCKKNTTPTYNGINQIYKADSLKISITKNNDFKIIDSTIIDSIANRVFNLQRIKNANKNCRLSLLIKEPINIGDDLELDFGVNSVERFQTLFIFFYKKKENVIFYYDTLNDVYIEVQKWDDEILKHPLKTTSPCY